MSSPRFDGDTLRRLYERDRRERAEIFEQARAEVAARLGAASEAFDLYVVECRGNGATWDAMARVLGTSETVVRSAYGRGVKGGKK